MARAGVANIVEQLKCRGFDPRKVGPDLWEARCPAHRSTDHALAISRNEHNHVVLECRSPQNCQYSTIIGALALPNDRVYAETSDWLISRSRRAQIQPASFGIGTENLDKGAGVLLIEGVNESSGALLCNEVELGADRMRTERSCQPESESASPVLPATSEVCRYAPGDWLELSEPDGLATGEVSEKVEPESSLQVLLRVAANARYFRSADGRLFAEVPVESRHEVHGLKSAAFRDWLNKAYFAVQEWQGYDAMSLFLGG